MTAPLSNLSFLSLARVTYEMHPHPSVITIEQTQLSILSSSYFFSLNNISALTVHSPPPTHGHLHHYGLSSPPTPPPSKYT